MGSSDTGLKLELKDFASKDLAKGILGSLLIDSATLHRFLGEAEQAEQDSHGSGFEDPLLPGAELQFRERTPSDSSGYECVEAMPKTRKQLGTTTALERSRAPVSRCR